MILAAQQRLKNSRQPRKGTSEMHHEFRNQLGDLTQQHWLKLVESSEFTLAERLPCKTPNAAGRNLLFAYHMLVLRHFHINRGTPCLEIYEHICFWWHSFSTTDFGPKFNPDRETRWIEEYYIYLASSMLLGSEVHIANAAKWYEESRQWYPPGAPFELGYVFLLPVIANELRVDLKLDESSAEKRINEEKSKDAQLLFTAIQSIRSNRKDLFLTQIKEHLKVYGTKVKKAISKTKNPLKDSVRIEYLVSAFGSMVLDLGRRKWTDLEPIPTDLAAFVLTKESIQD